MSHGIHKRPHDFFSDSDPSASCSPRRLDINGCDGKRFRRAYDSNDANREVIMTTHQTPSSFTPSSSSSEFVQGFAQSHIPTTRSVSTMNSIEANSVASMVYGDTTKKKEKKYTAAEVSRIVEEAVSLRESQLREEYENALKTMLAQQFNSFQQYHNEYISRHLRKQDSSYIS